MNNLEIKASSKYDWETIKKFNRFHNFTKNKSANIALVIMDIFCAFLFVLTFIWAELDFELIMIYLLLVFVNLVLVFAMFVLPKIQYKQNKQLHGVVNNIAFQENELLMEQCGENASGMGNFNYQALWRIYETKDSIYLYLNPRQAHIVNKSTVTGGTVEDLRMLLISKIGEKKYKMKFKA